MLRILAILLLTSLSLRAQITLTQCDLVQTGSTTTIMWTIAPGNTCEDLEVQHSTDSINYSILYLYGGICGNASFSQSYSFEHTNPVCGKTNYYRLVTRTHGRIGNKSIFVPCYQSGGFLFTTPPQTNQLKLTLNLSVSPVWNLELYDLSGKLIGKYLIQESEFTYIKPDGTLRTYIYRLTDDGNKTYSGKIIF
ncbi:MAG: hypothetical protein ACRCYO_11485 [Bacteroidia bacterium]